MRCLLLLLLVLAGSVGCGQKGPLYLPPEPPPAGEPPA
jgi:predicted small lipoprotein YifL